MNDEALNLGLWLKKKHIQCDIYVVADQSGSPRKAFILSTDADADKELAGYILEACNRYPTIKAELEKLKQEGGINRDEFAQTMHSLSADKRQLCASIRVALELLDSGNTTEVQRTLMAALSAANR